MRKLVLILLLSQGLILAGCTTGPMSVKVGKLNNKLQNNVNLGDSVADKFKDTADKFLGVSQNQEQEDEDDTEE